MKARTVILMSVAASSGMLLAGCGGGPDQTSNLPSQPPTPPPATDLDTAAVLAIVQTMTSETAEPMQVDASATSGGVVVVPTADETGSPISVDGT